MRRLLTVQHLNSIVADSIILLWFNYCTKEGAAESVAVPVFLF